MSGLVIFDSPGCSIQMFHLLSGAYFRDLFAHFLNKDHVCLHFKNYESMHHGI